MNKVAIKLMADLAEAIKSNQINFDDKIRANNLISLKQNPTPHQIAFAHRLIHKSKQIRYAPDNNYNEATITKFDKQGNVTSNEVIQT